MSPVRWDRADII